MKLLYVLLIIVGVVHGSMILNGISNKHNLINRVQPVDDFLVIEVNDELTLLTTDWSLSQANAGVYHLTPPSDHQADTTFRRVRFQGSSETYEMEIEITCSNGIFCDGTERFIRGVCEPAAIRPCGLDDSRECYQYECFEDRGGHCSRNPIGQNCDNCTHFECTPSCHKKTCGSDGCGGVCGTCAEGETCLSGTCQTPQINSGNCQAPVPLISVPAGQTAATVNCYDGTTQDVVYEGDVPIIPTCGFRWTEQADNSLGIDEVQPSCDHLGGSPDWFMKFKIASKRKVEIMALSPDLDPEARDTLLALYDVPPPNTGCLDYEHPRDLATDAWCVDDGIPPGGWSARIWGTLEAGEYLLLASSYSPSEAGLMNIIIKFADESLQDCTIACTDKHCGDDNCGGECGVTPTCEAGKECNNGQCVVVGNECVPDCQSRQCGYDANGCGFLCGECKGKKVCDFEAGVCRPIRDCDSRNPKCKSNRNGLGPKDKFCGTDCNWHYNNEPMVDLIPNGQAEVEATITFETKSFDETSCAFYEGCISGSGDRQLMRFGTNVHNIGLAGFSPPTPEKRPDLFEWSGCHGHFHFEEFAAFNLRDQETDEVMLPGAKLAFCMEDSDPYQTGPAVDCEWKFECARQGITRGWSDNYYPDLDCQWLDITNMNREGPGCTQYTYEVCTNIGRVFQEANFDNNCQRFPVWIPSQEIWDGEATVDYATIVAACQNQGTSTLITTSSVGVMGTALVVVLLVSLVAINTIRRRRKEASENQQSIQLTDTTQEKDSITLSMN